MCVTCSRESCLSLSESWPLPKRSEKQEQILLLTSLQLLRLHTADAFRCKLKSEFVSTYRVLILWRVFLQLKFQLQSSKIQVGTILLFRITLPTASCPWLFVEPSSFHPTFQSGSEEAFPCTTEIVAQPLCSVKRWPFNEVQKNPSESSWHCTAK